MLRTPPESFCDQTGEPGNSRMHTRFGSAPALLGSLLILLSAQAAWAQTTVFSDSFTDGSSVLTYANLSSITSQTISIDTELGSRARQVVAGNYGTLLALFPSTVSLGTATGDYLRLRFDFRTESNPGGYLRFGLFNSAGTIYSSANGDDTGYNADFGSTRQAWHATGGPAYYLSVGSPATNTPGTSLQRQLSVLTPVTFQLQLTRTETGATFTVHRGTPVAGATTLVYSLDHASPVTSFDEFAIFTQNARTYWLDNLTLSTSAAAIPEPGTSSAIAGLLGLGALAVRRTRRTGS